MGTYDIAFKSNHMSTSNPQSTLLQEAQYCERHEQFDEARKKYLQAIEQFQDLLKVKKHDLNAREGLITAWKQLATLYPNYCRDIFPSECAFTTVSLYDDVIPRLSLKTVFVDTFLESDWKKQCNGKYGGPKSGGQSWKEFYFENEKELDSLVSPFEKVSWAVYNGHYAFLDFIFERETVDVNQLPKEDNPETLLEVAIRMNYLEVAKRLLSHGANANSRGTGKWLPLHWGVYVGSKDSVKLLLAHDAQVNVKDDNEITPLHVAAFCGHEEVADLLLTRGARINAVEKLFGLSPLHLAVLRNQLSVCELLLNRGANVKGTDPQGRTLLHWAAAHGKADIAQLLLKKGLNVNSKDNLGRTALHWAAQCGELDTITVLVDFQARLNDEDKFQNRPMLIAAFGNYSKIVSYLFEHGAR